MTQSSGTTSHRLCRASPARLKRKKKKKAFKVHFLHMMFPTALPAPRAGAAAPRSTQHFARLAPRPNSGPRPARGLSPAPCPPPRGPGPSPAPASDPARPDPARPRRLPARRSRPHLAQLLPAHGAVPHAAQRPHPHGAAVADGVVAAAQRHHLQLPAAQHARPVRWPRRAGGRGGHDGADPPRPRPRTA